MASHGAEWSLKTIAFLFGPGKRRSFFQMTTYSSPSRSEPAQRFAKTSTPLVHTYGKQGTKCREQFYMWLAGNIVAPGWWSFLLVTAERNK